MGIVWRKTGLSIIILALVTVVRADCGSGALYIFPGGKVLSQNPMIVIEGYGDVQKSIWKLDKEYKAYLVGGHKKIRLVVQEICEGEFSLTQAILAPETKLDPAWECTLTIDSLKDYIQRYNEEYKEYMDLTYTVSLKADTTPPVIMNKPKETRKILRFYGCGPEMFVVYNFEVRDKSAIVVKATVKNQKSSNEHTYYLQPEDGEIRIGHGMCLGAFKFEEDGRYEVDFSFVDASGNQTVCPGKYEFTTPTEPTPQDIRE